MHTIIFKRGGSSESGSNFTGGTLTSPLILAGGPTQPLEAATKQYVDNGLAALNASNLTSGTVPVARLPAFTGDVSSSAGTNTLTLNNTGVTAGIYTKVTVDTKGRVTAGGALAGSDIPNLHWSKITTGKPTTLSGYGITDGINKFGDTMTGALTLSGNATEPLHAVPLQQLNEVASGNNGVEFIASGDIPNAGLTVGLNANGTVSVITENIQSGGWGPPTIIPTTFSSPYISYISTIYDSANQKVVIVYNDGGQGCAVVGTVLGNSISFGSPTIFNNTNTHFVSAVYDSTNQKVVIAYQHGGVFHSSIHHTAAIVGTVSGNNITFGTKSIFTNGFTYYISMVYDSANEKVVIVFHTAGHSHDGTPVFVIGTISGNSISFGQLINTPNTYNSNYVEAVYDSVNSKVIIFYNDYDQNKVFTRVCTVSGDNILFGPEVVFHEDGNDYVTPIYVPINQKVVVPYSTSNSNAVKVGTVSGNSISFGPQVIFNNAHSDKMLGVYDSTNQKVVIAYTENGTYGYGAVITGTISGNSILFNEPVIFNSDYTILYSAVYDSTNSKIVIAYKDNNEDAFAIVYSPGAVFTNKDRFIGISQSSATNGATIRVKVKGQVDSNQSGLTPGQLYYVSNNGTLTTTSTNNPLAGVAISATKLLIANWAIS